MAVLLKNLVARVPQTRDLAAITELVALCEMAEAGVVDSSLEDLLSYWQRPDFHLANDAWVIVTTRGEIVGFACIWHEESTRLSTYLCVHPEYRNRGIGTLLLRLVEVRAREHVRQAPAGESVILRGQVHGSNESTQRLFEREGYRLARQFLRVAFTLAEDTGSLPAPSEQQKLKVDVSVEQGRLLGATPLSDRDGLCSVHPYKMYEKELCPAARYLADVEAMLKTSDALASVG
jgi:ribosomal protein S18 acetylase RimI-like enzyme